MKFYLKILLFFLVTPVFASSWTAWQELSTQHSIHNPYQTPIRDDYYPFVLYDENQFNNDGDRVLYKMWHQGSNTIAVSYSNDGINWKLKGETNLPSASHAVVIYDKNGFGVGGKHYRIWYWNGITSSDDAGVILYSQSADGINWENPQPITQDAISPLVDANSFFFYELTGPGFVMYNPKATSIPDQPYSFPYVMFYDVKTYAQVTQIKSIALAYSNDGIHWSRYGNTPILIPSGNLANDWDATHLFRPTVFQSNGVFHLFYSGSNEYSDRATTVSSAHGIGHASSLDGLNWVKDTDNPIFIYSDTIAWRNTRTYTPYVLFYPFCKNQNSCLAKMWFTGGTNQLGANQGIGYATLTFK